MASTSVERGPEQQGVWVESHSGEMSCHLLRLAADHAVGSESCQLPRAPCEQSSVHIVPPLLYPCGLLHWFVASHHARSHVFSVGTASPKSYA